MSDEFEAVLTLESEVEVTPIVRVSEVDQQSMQFTVRVLVDDEPEE